MKSYIKLLIYSCIFCCIVYFFLTGGVALFIYLTKSYFFYPLEQVKRTIVFGIISGVAITVSALVFNKIGKHKTRKSSPSNPE